MFGRSVERKQQVTFQQPGTTKIPTLSSRPLLKAPARPPRLAFSMRKSNLDNTVADELIAILLDSDTQWPKRRDLLSSLSTLISQGSNHLMLDLKRSAQLGSVIAIQILDDRSAVGRIGCEVLSTLVTKFGMNSEAIAVECIPAVLKQVASTATLLFEAATDTLHKCLTYCPSVLLFTKLVELFDPSHHPKVRLSIASSLTAGLQSRANLGDENVGSLTSVRVRLDAVLGKLVNDPQASVKVAARRAVSLLPWQQNDTLVIPPSPRPSRLLSPRSTRAVSPRPTRILSPRPNVNLSPVQVSPRVAKVHFIDTLLLGLRQPGNGSLLFERALCLHLDLVDDLEWPLIGRILATVLETSCFAILDQLLQRSWAGRIVDDYGELLVSRLLTHPGHPRAAQCMTLLFSLMDKDRVVECLLDLPWDERSSVVILEGIASAAIPLDPRLPPKGADLSSVRARRILAEIR